MTHMRNDGSVSAGLFLAVFLDQSLCVTKPDKGKVPNKKINKC